MLVCLNITISYYRFIIIFLTMDFYDELGVFGVRTNSVV
jgi:hypothetical protein